MQFYDASEEGLSSEEAKQAAPKPLAHLSRRTTQRRQTPEMLPLNPPISYLEHDKPISQRKRITSGTPSHRRRHRFTLRRVLHLIHPLHLGQDTPHCGHNEGPSTSSTSHLIATPRRAKAHRPTPETPTPASNFSETLLSRRRRSDASPTATKNGPGNKKEKALHFG